MKQCDYIENTEEENKIFHEHLSTVIEVAIYVLDNLAIDRNIAVPHIPTKIGLTLINRMLFKRISDKEQLKANAKKKYLPVEFYQK